MANSLKCFGVGDGWASSDRFHSSYLYRIGESSFLVDAGEPLSRSFKAANLPYDSIDALALSHTHGDHVGGFLMFMQSLWLERRTKDLPIYLPEDAIEPLKQFLRACYIFPELMGFKSIYKPLEARVPFHVRDVKITPFRTTHLDSLRESFQKAYPQAFDAFAFLIQTGRQTIVHSADLGAVTDLEPLLQEPVDLLVCELAHFSPEELFTCLRDKAIAKAAFVHVGRPFWEKLDETKALARKLLPAATEVLFPLDGEEIAF
jgi:ribonuclease Z